MRANQTIHDSRLEINTSGLRYLIVYYNKALDDFNEAISRALQKHKLKVGEVAVLCLPKSGISDLTGREALKEYA